MQPSDIDIKKLIPHSNKMILINRLLYADEETAVADVIVGNQQRFSGKQSAVPAWIGMEYMAQTISALVGYRAYCRNEPVRIGFLLGTRKYSSSVNTFTELEILTVRTKENFHADNGLSSFTCDISSQCNPSLSVTASLNVFQTNDVIINQSNV